MTARRGGHVGVGARSAAVTNTALSVPEVFRHGTVVSVTTPRDRTLMRARAIGAALVVVTGAWAARRVAL